MSDIPYVRFFPTQFMHGVRGLTASEVGIYTMMLCRIYECDGPVEYNILVLSTYCGVRKNTFEKTMEKLFALGKLDLNQGLITNSRAEHEISHRAHVLKNKKKAGIASGEKRQQKQREAATGVQHQSNNKDKDKDNIKELTNVNSKKPKGFSLDQIKKAYEDWNIFAKRFGLAQSMTLTDQRKAQIRGRLKDAKNFGDTPNEGFRNVLRRASQSAYLLGQKNDYRMTLDSFLGRKLFIKTMEGGFDDNPNKPSANHWLRMAKKIKEDDIYEQSNSEPSNGADRLVDGPLLITLEE